MGYANFQFSEKLFLQLFTVGNDFGGGFRERITITEGMPEGSKIKEITFDTSPYVFDDGRGVIKVLVEHESFQAETENDGWDDVRVISTETQRLEVATL